VTPADQSEQPAARDDEPRDDGPVARYDDTWVVVPTFNEADNLPAIVPAILELLPGATVLVVDDNSPDGTGRLADEMAAANPQVKVLHRPGKQGLGRAYIAGFRMALDSGADRIVQMDADWSHHPRYVPQLLARLDGKTDASDDGRGGEEGPADLVIGSRYTKGGGVRNWGLLRKFVSRGGSLFGRTVLGLSPHDLTGGFKAWRRETLAATPWELMHSGGYVFSIEMTYLATRRGARVAEIPIIFIDRRVGQSKMSRRIVVEALFVVLRLKWEELRGRGAAAHDRGVARSPEGGDAG
jgi:dolichol-phosphate mannosyltransferase